MHISDSCLRNAYRSIDLCVYLHFGTVGHCRKSSCYVTQSAITQRSLLWLSFEGFSPWVIGPGALGLGWYLMVGVHGGSKPFITRWGNKTGWDPGPTVHCEATPSRARRPPAWPQPLNVPPPPTKAGDQSPTHSSLGDTQDPNDSTQSMWWCKSASKERFSIKREKNSGRLCKERFSKVVRDSQNQCWPSAGSEISENRYTSLFLNASKLAQSSPQQGWLQFRLGDEFQGIAGEHTSQFLSLY